VLLAHRAVVGAQEPALGEAEDEVDGGQPEGGVVPGGAETRNPERDGGLLGLEKSRGFQRDLPTG
jgi:hypothetical protein